MRGLQANCRQSWLQSRRRRVVCFKQAMGLLLYVDTDLLHQLMQVVGSCWSVQARLKVPVGSVQS